MYSIFWIPIALTLTTCDISYARPMHHSHTDTDLAYHVEFDEQGLAELVDFCSLDKSNCASDSELSILAQALLYMSGFRKYEVNVMMEVFRQCLDDPSECQIAETTGKMNGLKWMMLASRIRSGENKNVELSSSSDIFLPPRSVRAAHYNRHGRGPQRSFDRLLRKKRTTAVDVGLPVKGVTFPIYMELCRLAKCRSNNDVSTLPKRGTE